MGKRKRLGLIFSYDEQWIGGTYYIINLVHALNCLPEDDKPEILLFSNEKDFNQLAEVTGYQYLLFEDLIKGEYSRFEKFLNRGSFKLFGKKIIQKRFIKDIDALFIMQRSEYLESISAEKRIYWIPDFQEKHYPFFFNEDGLKHKDERSKWIHQNARKIVFSSNAVLSDWNNFYPFYKGIANVVHFAVTHPKYDHLSIEDLRIKHKLPEVYFFAPNQFWAHKNHIVVIKAVEELKQAGTPVVVAFSGKENDNRNLGYTESLKGYVNKNQLEDVVRFLGFIDRAEQLQLMKHGKAVIQPSLFEGWSTVIEDAMAMNKFVIAANIQVNQEQLGNKGCYFAPHNHKQLSEIIKEKLSLEESVDFDYVKKKIDFAKGIINAFDFD